MNIPNKREIVVVAVGLVTMFAAGRYSVTYPPNIKVAETKNQDTKTDEAKDTHVFTHTVSIKEPEGTVKTDTTTTTDVVVHEETNTVVEDKTVSQTTQQKRSKINVSAIVGTSLQTPGVPIYGVSVQKEFVGPVTIGVFGLQNGTLGVTVGLNF